MKDWINDIENGHLTPHVVDRTDRAPAAKDKPAQRHVNAFLRWCYSNWASDFAEVQDLVQRSKELPDHTEDPGFFYTDEEANPMDAGNETMHLLATRPRVLPPGTVTELFEA